MNIGVMRCANCLVHGWKQLEDENVMMQCSKCKLIQYCSKECQYEHWSKVHRQQCEYFADPSKCEPWQHNQQDCVICQQVAAVGEANLTNIDNPNYQCIHETLDDAPPELYHAHPFPIAGDPGDIREKTVIVLWQLLNKFRLIHPHHFRNWEEDFDEVLNTLVKDRLQVWFNRKIYPQPLARVSCSRLFRMLSGIEAKMANNESSEMVDPFQLWKIIMLVAQIEKELTTCILSQFLKDPLANLQEKTFKLVSDGMNNITKYLAVANDVLEALSTRIIPYEDVLKIICGGSLEQKCSFCSEDIFIRNEYLSDEESHFSHVFFSPLLQGKYGCGAEQIECFKQCLLVKTDHFDFSNALLNMKLERSINMCDFCFKLTPIKEVGSSVADIHRCSYCRKTMYCSIECLHQDWKIHLNVCHKDREGRKKKLGGRARREVARREAEEVEKVREGSDRRSDTGRIVRVPQVPEKTNLVI